MDENFKQMNLNPFGLCYIIRLDKSHFRSHLSNIFRKKLKLTKGKADEDYRHWPNDGYKYDIYNSPKPILLNGKHIQNFFTYKTGKASPNSKCAED